MFLFATVRIRPGRAVPSFLPGRYSAVKVRKKLYVTLVFTLFREHLRKLGIPDDHVIEVALDDEDNAALRDAKALYDHLNKHIGSDGTYYVLLDEVQCAITKKELRDTDNPPALYGVLNGLLHRGNVDVYVTGSNSKMLSKDVLTEFRGRGDEVHVMPLSSSEFMQVFDGDRYEGWAEYVMFGGLPALRAMRQTSSARYISRTSSRVMKSRRAGNSMTLSPCWLLPSAR